MPKFERLPSFLNYPRSISFSEGLLYGLVGDKEVPVEVIERTVRGSIASYQELVDPAAQAKKKAKPDDVLADEGAEEDPADDKPGKKDKQPKDTANANIQRIDVAHLPTGASRLGLKFSMIVQALSLGPDGCNVLEMRNDLKGFAEAFKGKGGYLNLAERYAWNLVNGRVLWRNRIARDKIVKIALDGAEPLVFECTAIPVDRFPGVDGLPEQVRDQFRQLSQAISVALSEKDRPLFAEIQISGELPSGAEVYPSQAFAEKDDSRKNEEGQKTKFLSSQPATVDNREVRHAIMHSQKIGNAVRTIDEWYPQVKDYGAVAIEAYGYVQHANMVVRQKAREKEFKEQGIDLYELLKDIDGLTRRVVDSKRGPVPNDALYAMANLIKGGVFSGSRDGKKAAASKPEGGKSESKETTDA